MPDSDADGMNIVGRRGKAHVARHRAALLREARHVDRTKALVLDVRRLPQHGRNRDNARAANARHDHAVGIMG